MSARVYVLLDVAQGELAEAVRTLRDRPGVIMADIVEGPPDIVMVLEAHQRRRLAELTVKALSSLEGMTENLQLLPVTANRRGHSYMPAVGRTESKMSNSGARRQGGLPKKTGRRLLPLGSPTANREGKRQAEVQYKERRDGARDD